MTLHYRPGLTQKMLQNHFRKTWRRIVFECLKENHWNRSRTSEALQINYREVTRQIAFLKADGVVVPPFTARHTMRRKKIAT